MTKSATTPENFNERRGDYALAEDVVWLTAEDGSSRLFEMNNFSYGLNETATRMLTGVTKGSLDDAVEMLADEFQIERAMIRADITLLVDQLLNSKLITANRRATNTGNTISHYLISGIYYSIFRWIISKFKNAKTEAFTTLTAVRICLQHAGLSETVAILERCLPACARTIDRRTADHALDEVESSVEASVHGHALEMACKERALCCWFMLRRRGIPAQVVVGVTLSPVFGHSWCQSGTRIVADTMERCGDFTPIWRR